MARILRRRPSAATAIAFVALFVALGGSSYAALRIGSRQIINNSVRGKDIRNRTIRNRDVAPNTLGGSRIRESSLGTVPNADRVDGQHAWKVSFRAPVGTPTTVVFNSGGLLINARCSAAGGLGVTATTTSNNAMIHVGTVHAAGGTPAAGFSGDNDFDIGQSVDVLPGGDNNVQGTLTYANPEGSVITLKYLGEEQQGGLASGNRCFFLGTAMQS